jgi:Ca2+-transporting ATPase
MLWVNLIMDILAAIALGTEPYSKDENTDFATKSNRISRRDKIMQTEMWRQILVQSAYQVLVCVILMYFGNFIFFDKAFNLITMPLRDA